MNYLLFSKISTKIIIVYAKPDFRKASFTKCKILRTFGHIVQRDCNRISYNKLLEHDIENFFFYFAKENNNVCQNCNVVIIAH